MIKTVITYGISFLFLIGTFHLDVHSHTVAEDYAICEINCDDNGHHYSQHLCEKCLNNYNRLISPTYSDLLYNNNYRQIISTFSQDYISVFSFFNIYSRPPPANLA